jgi:hypothetical protein
LISLVHMVLLFEPSIHRMKAAITLIAGRIEVRTQECE